MSAVSVIKASVEQPSAVTGYDPVLKAVHWATLLLIAAAFAAVWTSHAVASKEQYTMLVQLHRSLGVTVFGLTLFRVGWRRCARIPRLPADLPGFQRFAARAVEYFFYLALLVQPILGLLHSNARGARVDFYFLGELPAIIAPDRVLAKQLITVHELVADLLLSAIALHAAAALFHHFVRRDDVLETMLPGRRG